MRSLLLLCLFLILPLHLHAMSCQFIGEEEAEETIRYIPVVRDEPEGFEDGAEMKFLVSPSSEVIAAICETEDNNWRDACMSTAKLWQFKAGNVSSKPCWSLTTVPLNFVFFTKGLPSDATAPHARFTVSSRIATQLRTPIKSFQGRSDLDFRSVEWTLRVEPDGSVSSVKSRSDVGRAMCEAISLLDLTFAPASQNGNAIPCDVVLKILADPPPHDTAPPAEPFTPPLTLKTPFDGNEAINAKITLDSIQSGSAKDIRLSGNVPKAHAISILSGLMNWRFPDATDVRRYCACYNLVPGEIDLSSDCSLQTQVVQLPKITHMDRPDVRRRLGDVITLMLTIDEHGKVQKVEPDFASHADIIEPCKKAIMTADIEPGLIDGKPAAVRVVLPIVFEVQ